MAMAATSMPASLAAVKITANEALIGRPKE